jgi:co-chaperonin GroES (HSP10)
MEGEVVAVGPGVRNEAGKLHPLDVGRARSGRRDAES